MADSFTTNNNWTKPEVGASADSWGGKLNADLDSNDAQTGGVIFGLTLSTAGSSGTFGIATGGASGMALASAYTKTTGSWAVGTGNGALDTGSIANSTWYHVWLIERVDTSVVDVLVSTSATSPTMPSNYTRKRRIGAVLTDGSAHWTSFTQLDHEFLWAAPVHDVADSPFGGTAALKTLTVPTGIKVSALIRGKFGGSASTSPILVQSPDETSALADATAGNITGVALANGVLGFQVQMRTNASAQVRMSSTVSDANLNVVTYGWVDPRGRY